MFIYLFSEICRNISWNKNFLLHNIFPRSMDETFQLDDEFFIVTRTFLPPSPIQGFLSFRISKLQQSFTRLHQFFMPQILCFYV